MATVKTVKDPEPDPKQGKARARSGVRFPYNDLAESIEVARVIHERAAGVCDLAQLAALLNYSGVSNGAFRTRVSAAKMFGLIEEADEQKLRVSVRGQTIVAPISDAHATRAKVEAFMSVDLFKRVYEQFHGAALPEPVGLRNLLQTEYQVVPDRVAPTVRIMLDSADQAGLFKATGNRSRMVLPLAMPGTPMAPPAPPAHHAATPSRTGGNGGGGGGGGGGGDVGEIDPAILGLLRRLPPGGTPISAKKRKLLIDAFTAMVGFIYPDAEGEDS